MCIFLKSNILLILFGILVGCAQQPIDPVTQLNDGEINSTLNIERFVQRLESSCPDREDLYPYEKLIELRDHPIIPGLDYDFRLYQAFATSDFVQPTREKSCKLALLENMEEGIQFCLETLPKTSYQHNHFYLELAFSKYAKFALDNSLKSENDFQEADSLLKTYIDSDDGSYEPDHALPYYFAASKLITLTRLSKNPVYIKALLNRSIAISNAGLLKAKDPSEIMIALNSAKNYWKIYKSHLPGF